MCLLSYAYLTFCSCDLDIEPMTLIYDFGLDILTMYLCIKNEVSRSRLSKVRGLEHEQSHTNTDASCAGLPIRLIKLKP